MLKNAMPGGTFLLNSVYGPDTVWDHLPREVQAQIVEKQLNFYVIDAYKVGKLTGMGVRINTIMQTCFFAISGVLERDEAIAKIKKSIQKTYERKGPEVVKKNFAAVDQTLENLHKVEYPHKVTSQLSRPPTVAQEAPEFVHKLTAEIIAGRGDQLPTSAFPVDGVFPTGTTQWEKRNIALDIPVWSPEICIQCNRCAFVCPHAAIRAKVYDPKQLEHAPPTFKHTPYKGEEFPGQAFTIQVAPEDCTGCTLCVEACPVRDKKTPGKRAVNMQSQLPLREPERANLDFFLALPEVDRRHVALDTVKGTQFLQPLFEYSGACSGCGETPYVKLLTQLFGDRALIANATGCSSIYGGNLPTTPYACNAEGRGPAWANSLFEDNAEFGYGMRLAVDKLADHAKEILKRLAGKVGDQLVQEILSADQSSEAGIEAQRGRVLALRKKLTSVEGQEARWLEKIAEYLLKKSVWIVGGDGWAYDIGYGGLDHVIASGRDVNILVLDTEVYSNTGGQASKATPMAAAAKFAVAGKATHKKDLAMLAMTYGNAYVARVAMAAKDAQTVNAFKEAESYPGTSVIVAYSHCIAHGYDMADAVAQQERAVDSAYWSLFRYDPRKAMAGESPLKLDSGAPKLSLAEFLAKENRFNQVQQANPEVFKALVEESQRVVKERFALLEQLAKAMAPANLVPGAAGGPPKARA